MPLASIHLLSLSDSTKLIHLLNHIRHSTVRPLVVSKPIRWVIYPERIETKQLLDPKWDLLLILQDSPASKDLISGLTSDRNQWTITSHYQTVSGIPSRLTSNFSTTNEALLHPSPSSVPKLTGALDKPLVESSSQSLTLSPELQAWVKSFSQTTAGKNAVSMLNLLAFKPELKSSYLQYGKAFGETIGAKRGGNAKLVGHIIHEGKQSGSSATSSSPASQGRQDRWDEFALAHYPSIMHFADMLASEDYQAVNQKYRVPALKDTCILCTSEIEIEELMRANEEKAKL